MQGLLNKARQRSEHERKLMAIGAALSIVLVIFFIWLSVQVSTFSSTEAVEYTVVEEESSQQASSMDSLKRKAGLLKGIENPFKGLFGGTVQYEKEVSETTTHAEQFKKETDRLIEEFNAAIMRETDDESIETEEDSL